MLTSRVIGSLGILEPRCRVAVLDSLLGTDAGGHDGKITFWPTFARTEPDVVVQFEDVTLVIEAKDVAGHLTSEQLTREWRDVSAERKTPVVMVALTADPAEPEVVLKSREEVESDGGQPNAIRWTRWQSLARVYEQLQQDPDVSDVSRRLIGELLRFMQVRGVRGFTGLEMEEINLFRETWSRPPTPSPSSARLPRRSARSQTAGCTRFLIARDLTGTERARRTARQTNGVRLSWSSGSCTSGGRRS